MSLNRVVFIHGNGSDNWAFAGTPWLKAELEKLHIPATFETFPDPVLARKQYWLPFLDRLKVDANTLLIGWSSGAVAAMRYAENHQIAGSILVAPCYTDLGLESEKVSGWYNTPWQWNKIKANQKMIGLFYSSNDQYIPIEEFIFIEKQLQPNYVYQSEKEGHFTKKQQFPEILDCLKQMQKSK